MTEVGAAMHTDPSASAESGIAMTMNNGEQLKSQQNNPKEEDKANTAEAMEVDSVEAEEDDAQISSSTENGNKNRIETTSRHTTILTSEDDSNKMSTEPDSTPTKVVSTTTPTDIAAIADESTSNPCDSVSQNCIESNSKGCLENDGDAPNQADDVPAENRSKDSNQMSDESDGEDAKSPVAAPKVTKAAANAVSAAVTDSNDNADAKTICEVESTVESIPNNIEVPTSSADREVVVHNANADSPAVPTDSSRNASPIVDNLQSSTVAQKENGMLTITEKARADTSVVNLDDTDEEMEAVPKSQTESEGRKSVDNGVTLMRTQQTEEEKSGAKARSICSDSDGAVVIGSDSETELPSANATVIKKTETEVVDEDDDCVVIEDDSPAPTVNDLSKRKSMAMDSPSNSDDSQPPTKRQRNSNPQTQVNFSQIAIKDARSLMPQDPAAKRLMESGVYPVNLTPAANIAQGPPKLVPVLNTPSLPVGGLPGMNANANLLPGLTDDMFVLEAPSFIVPYIYEKPPSDNLGDVIREIEAKYRLTKEDLAEADKSDEFDMMTEQNKDEKDEKTTKKKKKRRGGDDGDESWSEESEEDDDDDDDDDSESGMRTKVLIKEASDDLTVLKVAIKPASAVVQSQSPSTYANKPGQENYFESPLGKFFMDIGVGLVQEYVQSDLIRLQKRKMRKSLGKNITEYERAIAALSGNLEASRKKNGPFKFTMKRCEFCNFKSESALAMANHYETPHMNGPHYKCNFCIFEIRNATEIVYHMEAVHNIKARLVKPLPYHQCPNCGFEDNGKAKLARHQPVCAKKFRPELNLAPPNDWEAPAKIPRIKPRHGLVGTATAYQAMAAQAAAQKAALASIQQQQQQVAHARSIQAAALAAQNAANKIRGRPPIINKQTPNAGAPVFRGPSMVRNPVATTIVMPNNFQIPGNQLSPPTPNILSKKNLTGQPSISITPLPRQSALPAPSSPSTSKLPPAGTKPGQAPAGSKTQFVICEICDGYIKDLEQLRNHMQWMHKVKIHPKMIYNRPPLNCQKCQFRFFTDQGLERHLLGSHGLVTSSMQEAANKGKDSGRCPVCGRMYQWKLLNHVSRDHHMTLKPAHLSYKCTVCTATFGMYKQFETHVYTAHSTVAKKAMDGKKNNSIPSPASASGSSSSVTSRTGLSAANDSLLKPLKINDEITIIPQPASKPRISNMESHVID